MTEVAHPTPSPPPMAPVKVTATVNVNTIVPYLVAIVLVFGIGASVAVWAPTQVATIIAAAAPILMALLTILKNQTDAARQTTEIHDAVNSTAEASHRELLEAKAVILKYAKLLSEKGGIEMGRDQVHEEIKVAEEVKLADELEAAKNEDKPPTAKVPVPPD